MLKETITVHHQLGITLFMSPLYKTAHTKPCFTVYKRFPSEPAGVFPGISHWRGKTHRQPRTTTLPMCERRLCLSFSERGDSEEKRWSKEVCASVPLRVPRPGLDVGKVTQCLSHDPGEEAFSLLDPWMEVGRHRKGTPSASQPHRACDTVTVLFLQSLGQSCSHEWQTTHPEISERHATRHTSPPVSLSHS